MFIQTLLVNINELSKFVKVATEACSTGFMNTCNGKVV